MNKLEKRIKKLKHLVQYKNYSEEELAKIAQQQLDKEEILSSLTSCLDSEKKYAEKLLNNYLEEASFENFSEKDTLRQLINLEIVVERLNNYLKSEAEKTPPSYPLQTVEQITKLNSQIMEIKEKLCLVRKDKEQLNALEEWKKLKAKALTYYKENAGCNVVKCPECKKLFMILKDMRGHTTEKIKFFKRTLLYNKEMYSWLDKGIITNEQLASAFGVSIDYINLIYENIYKNDK